MDREKLQILLEISMGRSAISKTVAFKDDGAGGGRGGIFIDYSFRSRTLGMPTGAISRPRSSFARLSRSGPHSTAAGRRKRR